jgi:hypothetical protein
MQRYLENWKTTLPGLILVSIGLLESMTGVHIPGFNMDAGAALTAGLAAILAKDA